MAFPSAILSGQKLTSTRLPLFEMTRSTSFVTPGYTVLRRTRCCPSTKTSRRSLTTFGTASGSGFKCSSTGVPITKITCSADEMTFLSLDAENFLLARTCFKSSLAPGSSNGILPEFTFVTAVLFRSKAHT